MKTIKLILSVLFLAGTLGASATLGWSQVISKVSVSAEGNYCHLRFPAIREDTLYWDQPVLKDPSSGDIIDFYGPCDYNPLSKEQILAQRDRLRRDLSLEKGPE